MSNTINHTPGIWTCNRIEGKPALNIRTGHQSIAQVYENIGSNVLNDRDGQGEANAQLIAAAPALLEALQALLKCEPMVSIISGDTALAEAVLHARAIVSTLTPEARP